MIFYPNFCFFLQVKCIIITVQSNALNFAFNIAQYLKNGLERLFPILLAF